MPFDDAKPAQLTVPVEAWHAGPLTCEEDDKEVPEPALHPYDVQQIPSPEAYMAGVRQGLAGIAKRRIQQDRPFPVIAADLADQSRYRSIAAKSCPPQYKRVQLCR